MPRTYEGLDEWVQERIWGFDGFLLIHPGQVPGSIPGRAFSLPILAVTSVPFGQKPARQRLIVPITSGSITRISGNLVTNTSADCSSTGKVL